MVSGCVGGLVVGGGLVGEGGQAGGRSRCCGTRPVCRWDGGGLLVAVRVVAVGPKAALPLLFRIKKSIFTLGAKSDLGTIR